MLQPAWKYYFKQYNIFELLNLQLEFFLLITLMHFYLFSFFINIIGNDIS